MAGVPQATLNWLHDVLKREYREVNRTYTDVAQALAQYPGLAPRTDVFTSQDGVSALLLNLKGTLPVNFRGTVYRFPIALWLPHSYPYEAPVMYVTPTDEMIVRQGQHVSGADGRIYHPYLAAWAQASERSNIVEVLRFLADVFAREPPVMAKGAAPVIAQQQHHSTSPPLVPPTAQTQLRNTIAGNAGPPRPPPKQRVGEETSSRPDSATLSSSGARPGRYDAPPPLPSQSRTPDARRPNEHMNGHIQQMTAGLQNTPRRQSSHSTYAAPPGQQSSMPQQYQQPPTGQPAMQTRRRSPPPPPPNQPQTYGQPSQPMAPPPIQDQRQQIPLQGLQQVLSSRQVQPQQPFSQRDSIRPQQQPQQQQQQPNQQSQRQRQLFIKPQPKDLLSEDDPFQVSLPVSQVGNIPAPPIPTNPEKTALISHLSTQILTRLHQAVSQTEQNALPSLYSQRTALTDASQTLESELRSISALSTQLKSNVSALQSTLAAADKTITNTKTPTHSSSPTKIPSIDEIIIPPSVLTRQLYDSVAEQRAYEAAIYALNEAFVRGRIGSEIWGRKCREMAREEFRRMWVIRKIGVGMGLQSP